MSSATVSAARQALSQDAQSAATGPAAGPTRRAGARPVPPSADLASVPDERLEAELCQLAADLASGTARWFRSIAEYDRRQIWSSWECRSMAHFLAGHVGVSLVTARQYVQVARLLPQFPALAAEFEAGRLSYSRVRAVCRVITPTSEADLVQMALHATAPQLERFVAKVERAERSANADDEVGQHERRELVIVTDDDGTFIVRGRFTAEDGAVLRRAVEFEVQRTVSHNRAIAAAQPANTGTAVGVELPFGQLRADALVRLIEAGHVSLSQQAAPVQHDAAASMRPLVVIHRHLDGDELESGRGRAVNGGIEVNPRWSNPEVAVHPSLGRKPTDFPWVPM